MNHCLFNKAFISVDEGFMNFRSPADSNLSIYEILVVNLLSEGSNLSQYK